MGTISRKLEFIPLILDYELVDVCPDENFVEDPNYNYAYYKFKQKYSVINNAMANLQLILVSNKVVANAFSSCTNSFIDYSFGSNPQTGSFKRFKSPGIFDDYIELKHTDDDAWFYIKTEKT